MSIEQDIEKANQRLKAANTGLVIFKRGSKLSLRGMLPPKPGKQQRSQQTIALDVFANPAGIKRAEAEAKKVAGLLALREFDWNFYLDQQPTLSQQTVSHWVERFEEDYFRKRSRNAKSETTFKTDYRLVFNTLPMSEPLTADLLYAAVIRTEPDSRSRKRFCMVTKRLAQLAGVPFDVSDLAGNYSPKKVSPRYLPSDAEIAHWWAKIPNSTWQYVFGLMATYGLRNHEVFNLDLSGLKKSPGILTVIDGKTGGRRIWPCYPEWWERWELWDIQRLPMVTGKDNSALGNRVTNALKRYGFLKPYNLRHAWAVRTLEFGLDVSLAAAQMGHSVQIHCETYHHWITDRTHQRAFEALMQRSDRPTAP